MKEQRGKLELSTGDILGGPKRIRLHYSYSGTKMAPKEHANGIAPNVIHSLDAAALHRVVLATPADTPITTVHDAFGVLPSQVSDLRVAISAAYGEVIPGFLEGLKDEWEEILKIKLPPVPRVGTLDEASLPWNHAFDSEDSTRGWSYFFA